MIKTSKSRKFVIGLLLMMIGGVLVGCQGIHLTFNGKTVAPEARIPLKEGGPFSGVWETNQMVFNYIYSWKSGYFEITGDLALGNTLSGFRSDFIFFRVNFIDEDGKLIESKVARITSSSYRRASWSVKFNMKTPPKTGAIGFCYMGSVRRGSGHDESTSWTLWKSPLG